MKRLLTIIFAILFLVLLAELGFYFYLAKTKKSANITNKTYPAYPSYPPSPKTSPAFEIIYQKEEDNEGRTILYRSTLLPYPEVGEFYDEATSPARLLHIIGAFSGWEAIDGSKDRYLLLQNPITGKPLIKTRVAFEKSELFDQGRNATAIGIEVLEERQSKSFKTKIYQLSEEKIDRLIRKDDILIVIPLYFWNRQGKAEKVQVDKSGVSLASWLVIRRNKNIEITNL